MLSQIIVCFQNSAVCLWSYENGLIYCQIFWATDDIN